jgi:hypothetical protein
MEQGMSKKEKKQLPGPCGERQLMYMTSEADVTLFGGEMRLQSKLS